MFFLNYTVCAASKNRKDSSAGSKHSQISYRHHSTDIGRKGSCIPEGSTWLQTVTNQKALQILGLVSSGDPAVQVSEAGETPRGSERDWRDCS